MAEMKNFKSRNITEPCITIGSIADWIVSFCELGISWFYSKLNALIISRRRWQECESLDGEVSMYQTEHSNFSK